MKRLFPLLLLAIIFFIGCRSSNDQAIAEVHNVKLYRSEIESLLPAGLSFEDSVKMANHLIDNWVKKQLIIHEANNYLSTREKTFEKELDNYRKDLLINAFFQKLTNDSTQFTYSDDELLNFVRQYEDDFAAEREILKLNYVKLSPRSKVLKPLRDILFDEQRRMFEKERIEEICADSIEYFIQDQTWIFWDDVKNDLPLEMDLDEELTDENRYIERKLGNYLYLVVLLDKSTTPYNISNSENVEAAKTMILQQKKTEFINQYIELLYKNAEENNLIIR
ncbi:hypothetical protein LJC68_02875 [Bacteroidales bacterium OttesenSCG-928-B11]|nr:hypothetical protein [Bacteroidales bacterium OttesenSCG-928-B11]MDL2326188.1 hypothetical protein [Bacteroidales bacterium OttesenSCG-928-A14]